MTWNSQYINTRLPRAMAFAAVLAMVGPLDAVWVLATHLRESGPSVEGRLPRGQLKARVAQASRKLPLARQRQRQHAGLRSRLTPRAQSKAV